MSETVKLNIGIYVSVCEDAADTGVTVEDWNAMDGEGRGKVARDLWVRLAVRDDTGDGMHPVTDGAVEI